MTRAPGNLFQRREIDPAAVAAALTAIEEQHKARAWVFVLGGSLLCLAVAVALAVLYFLLSGLNTIGDWPFKYTVLIMAVVCVPAMFLLAANLQRGLPQPGAPGDELLADRGREGADTPESVARSVAEKANLGPRMVLWGVAQLRGRSAFGPVSHERVTAALTTLAAADGGIAPVKLILPGESADQLEPLLGVLLHHDLADLSKRADKVWITTDAKRKMGLPV